MIERLEEGLEVVAWESDKRRFNFTHGDSNVC